MPPRKQPASLQRLCARKVLEVHAKLLYNSFRAESSRRPPGCLGPFVFADEIGETRNGTPCDEVAARRKEMITSYINVLPTCVVRKLLQPAGLEAINLRHFFDGIGVWGELSTGLTKAGLKWWLHPSSTTMDVSWWEMGRNMVIETDAYHKGGLENKPGGYLASMVLEAIPLMGNNLTRVKLSELRGFSPVIIQALARYAPHLEELDLSGVIGVTDAALAVLGVTNGGGGVHGCPKLRAICLQRCGRVSGQAAKRLLKELVELEQFQCEHVSLGVFEELLVDHHAQGERQKFRLMDLKMMKLWSAGRLVHPEEFVSMITEACPRLQSIGFAVSAQLNEQLFIENLHRISSLRAVSLRFSNKTSDVTVFPALKTFLENMGPRLTALEVTCSLLLRPMLVTALGTYSVNLRNLVLVEQQSFNVVYPTGPTFLKRADGFRNLVRFCLKSCLGVPWPNIMEDELVFVLSEAKKLEFIDLRGVQAFMTDGFWINFLNSINGLEALQVARLICRHPSKRISSDVIVAPPLFGPETAEAFISSCPELRTFVGPPEWGLVKEDVDKIVSRVKSQNLDLDLVIHEEWGII